MSTPAPTLLPARTLDDVFTDPETLALAGFLAGDSGLPARRTASTCASSPPGAPT